MAPKTKSPMSLTQTDDFWYCAVRRLRTWIEVDKGSEEYRRPWLLVVANLNTGTLSNLEVLLDEPGVDEIHKVLVKTMLKPAKGSGSPHRPAEIHFEDRALVEGLRLVLQEIGVVSRFQPRRKLMDEMINSLQSEIFSNEDDIPGLLDQPGVKPALVGKLFEAAEFFFREEPWINLANEDLLAIGVGSQKEPYYCSVMGIAGQEYGLSIFLTWQEVESFFTARDPDETIPAQGRHVFFFDLPPIVSFDDMDAAEKYGWKLPAPDIYPTPLVFTPDEVLRPNAEMLRWYEAVLRALPVFVEDHLQTQPDGSHPPVEAAVTVQTSAGKTAVQFRYPGGDLDQVRNWMGSGKKMKDEDSDEPVSLPPDRRGMESFMADLTAGIGGISNYADPKVAEAQQIMYQAWEEANPSRRASLAKKALKISANCADAYVCLAEAAADHRQALALFQKGVEAGRRALGSTFFEDDENTGHFWGILETRPFMRSLAGYGTTLWELGRRDEALAQYQELLRLNPGDNQGIRYLLLDLLLEMDRIDDAGALLKEYPDEWSADWAYTEALLAFRKSGSNRQSKAALKRALKVNQHVPDYLTSKKRVPLERSPYITMGGEDEAIQYAAAHLNYWRKTPGAVAWLEDAK